MGFVKQFIHLKLIKHNKKVAYIIFFGLLLKLTHEI